MHGSLAGENAVDDMVSPDFITAKIFEKHGIDFCCGGKVPLAEACMGKGLDLAVLTRDVTPL